MSASDQTLPISLYESLIIKLALVLELTQRPEGTISPQAKQDLLQATNDFKTTLSRAKEIAGSLPGGELIVDEQDQVIEMLEQLRETKRQQLAEFSARSVASSTPLRIIDRIDIDSMASTPPGA